MIRIEHSERCGQLEQRIELQIDKDDEGICIHDLTKLIEVVGNSLGKPSEVVSPPRTSADLVAVLEEQPDGKFKNISGRDIEAGEICLLKKVKDSQ